MAASVVSKLKPRDRRIAVFIGKHGILRPYLTVAAARKADITIASACALLEKESSGGRNIFGCDHGSSGDRPPYCQHNVTETRARRLRASSFSNGVGPCQLTFKGFIDRARKLGGEWRPFVNMVVGFSILAELAERENSLREGARAYNGSGPAAEAYARDFMAKRERWQDLLQAADL